jgi:hypothetical protein
MSASRASIGFPSGWRKQPLRVWNPAHCGAFASASPQICSAGRATYANGCRSVISRKRAAAMPRFRARDFPASVQTGAASSADEPRTPWPWGLPMERCTFGAPTPRAASAEGLPVAHGQQDADPNGHLRTQRAPSPPSGPGEGGAVSCKRRASRERHQVNDSSSRLASWKVSL